MGLFQDFLRSKTATPQNGVPQQQPAGNIVIPTLDTTNAIGSVLDILGPTPAEREAQERRLMQNRTKMQAWTGLFDGLRQLGNLYYATRGATPQPLNNSQQIVDNEIQQQRQFYDNIANYKRQYNTSLYNLQRQMNEDVRKDKLADAQQSWYNTRDEMARLKAENDRLKAEASARNTDARTKNTEAKTETENFLRDKRGNEYDSRATKNLQQGQAAVTRANKSGGSKKKDSSKGKKVITGYQIQGENKKGRLY